MKFLVYDQNKDPIGVYTTDDGGYIYIDDLTVQGKGKLFIRELEAAPGYELDKQYKTPWVVGLADAFDALIHPQVYKPAYPREQARDMIVPGACGVFHPLLLACFAQHIGAVSRAVYA